MDSLTIPKEYMRVEDNPTAGLGQADSHGQGTTENGYTGTTKRATPIYQHNRKQNVDEVSTRTVVTNYNIVPIKLSISPLADFFICPAAGRLARCALAFCEQALFSGAKTETKGTQTDSPRPTSHEQAPVYPITCTENSLGDRLRVVCQESDQGSPCEAGYTYLH